MCSCGGTKGIGNVNQFNHLLGNLNDCGNVGGCGCGMGDISEAEMETILTEHYKSKDFGFWSKVGAEAISGKYDTAMGDVKELFKKYCMTGAKNGFTEWLNTYKWWLLGGSVLAIGGYYALNKK